MSEGFYVSRLAENAKEFNTLNIRTVELYFHKSPGWREEDQRGIEGLEYEVFDGTESIQSGTTEKDGKVLAQVRGGESRLKIADSTYKVKILDEDYEDKSKVLGVKQRLRNLGYQLGGAGPRQDGVDVNVDENADRTIMEFQVDMELDLDGVANNAFCQKLDDEVKKGS
jgi:hypothetical protein